MKYNRTKFLLILTVFFLPLLAKAQVDSLTAFKGKDTAKQIKYLKEAAIDLDIKTEKLQTQIQSLNNKERNLSDSIDDLKRNVQEQKENLNELYGEFEKKAQKLTADITGHRKNTNSEIASLDKNLSQSTLYGIIAFLIVAIIALTVFLVLRKKLRTNQASLQDKLTKTREDFEAEAVRMDEKLVELLDKQLKVMQEEENGKQDGKSEAEADHSLALKVADEIVRIEKNLNRMDESTKGKKQLAKAVNRIKDNFAANGYEMVELIGKKFDERMNATVVNTITDESLTSGEQIITRIIKPQINYQGKMIQAAQVEVSVN